MKKKYNQLDEYEQEIEDNLEKTGTLPAAEKAKLKKLAIQAAHNYSHQKVVRLNISVIDEDLKKIKKLAKDDGVSYQAFITTILHKATIHSADHGV